MIGFGGGLGGGAQQPLTGEFLEDAKKQQQEYLDYVQKHLEETRAEYLSKSRDLKREERRLKELEKQAEAEETRAAQAGPSSDPKKPTDIDRRLSDVERKLDLILKALENPDREAGKK